MYYIKVIYISVQFDFMQSYFSFQFYAKFYLITLAFFHLYDEEFGLIITFLLF